MHKSGVLNRVTRLVSALALLVSVMSSPIRPNMVRGVASPNHLHRNFGIPGKAPSNHRPHVPVPSRIVQVKAVSSESKLDGMVLPSLLRVDPPGLAVSSLESARASSGFRIDRTSHALRC